MQTLDLLVQSFQSWLAMFVFIDKIGKDLGPFVFFPSLLDVLFNHLLFKHM